VRRILLIRLHNLGDVLLTTPALRRLRAAHPDARIDYLTRASGAQALEGTPYLDEVLVYPAGGARAEWALLRELRARRYDAVVDFLSTARSARAVWASGAPLRVGVRGRGPRNALYTHLTPNERVLRVYAAERMVRMLAPLSVETASSDLALELAIGDAERAWAAEWLEGAAVFDGDAPLVAVSGVSRDARKQWGADRWAAVADALVEAGARVLLTYGPGEAEQAERIAHAMQCAALLGPARTSVRQLGALYERVALWVGNDGGARHVAVAAGAPTLAVMRHGIGALWTEPTPELRHRSIEGAPGDDSGRGGIDAITPDAVAVAALELLGADAARGGIAAARP
jgi:ADP-heptose:LPS heptosyltransferase